MKYESAIDHLLDELRRLDLVLLSRRLKASDLTEAR